MNLAERLRVRNSKLIYGTPNVFRYKDERVYNYVDLIFMVLEKYSKLFGEVTPEKSDRLKLQLAEKYTNSHHKTLVGLDIKLFVGKVERLSLIRDKYWKTRSAILENKWAKQIKIDELTLAYKESKTYVLIADKGHLECDCCGLVFPSDMLKCLNRWVICSCLWLVFPLIKQRRNTCHGTDFGKVYRRPYLQNSGRVARLAQAGLLVLGAVQVQARFHLDDRLASACCPP